MVSVSAGRSVLEDCPVADGGCTTIVNVVKVLYAVLTREAQTSLRWRAVLWHFA